jgi:hypothetical protein
MSGSNDIHPSEKTEVIRGRENVINAVEKFAANENSRIDICLDQTRPALMVAIKIGPRNELFANIKSRGIHLRVLTEITASNISSCKRLNELVDDLRHLDGIKGTFYTSETEYLVPAVYHEEGKAASQMIYTNVRELVEQQQYIFDTLWYKSIPADEKIMEIEEGIQPRVIETIRDPHELQRLAFDLARSAREEMLILFSTAKAFLRQTNLGGREIGKEVASKYGVKIRILTPYDDSIKQQAHQHHLQEYADVRYIPEELQTQISIVIVDRKSSVVIETKDDTKDSSYEAIDLGTYSNSASTVSSYVSIFETLWRQSELYENSQNQLRSAEDELSTMKEYLNEVINEVAKLKNKGGCQIEE